MIKLYGFGPSFNLPDPSPFVTKVDLILRAAGIDYQMIGKVANLRKAPKSKLPFIEDDGQIIADSVFIIEHLKQKHNINLDGWLSDEQAALSQLLGKSLDENMYWLIVNSRWLDDDTWPTVKQQFFSPMPFPLNHIVAYSARSATRKQINGHGMGKHSNQEITQIAHNSWKSLSTLLGDKPYFFGDKISNFDANAFAILSTFSLCSLRTKLSDEFEQYPNLIEFTKRVAKEFYPDEINLA